MIDLESGNAKALGKPHDQAFLSWLPDGEHLVALIRSRPDPAAKTAMQARSIVLLGMDGKSTPLCEGDMPLLLK